MKKNSLFLRFIPNLSYRIFLEYEIIQHNRIFYGCQMYKKVVSFANAFLLELIQRTDDFHYKIYLNQLDSTSIYQLIAIFTAKNSWHTDENPE